MRSGVPRKLIVPNYISKNTDHCLSLNGFKRRLSEKAIELKSSGGKLERQYSNSTGMQSQ